MRIAMLAIAALVFCQALAVADVVHVATGPDWRAIGPIGDLSGTPIASVGDAWEAANAGWNSSLSYDDSATSPGTSAVWHDAVLIFGSKAIIWSDGDGFNGTSPAYFRKLVNLPAITQATIVDGGADDDFQFYVNGIQVINDTDGTTTNISNVDITPYLHAGDNLLAVKAHDTAGVGEGLRLEFLIVVPEPSTLLLALCGAAAFVCCGRSRVRTSSRAK